MVPVGKLILNAVLIVEGMETLNVDLKRVKYVYRRIYRLDPVYFRRILNFSKTLHTSLGGLMHSSINRLIKLKVKGKKPRCLEYGEDKPSLKEYGIRINERQYGYARRLIFRNDKGLFIAYPGFGKTRILFYIARLYYLRGYSTLILLPEITMVNIMIEDRSISNFREILKWHSSLRGLEKDESILRISSQVNVVVGTRSAFFLPIFRLKIILVDEAHDSSFNQEVKPYYNLYHGLKEIDEPVLFTTATPIKEMVMDVGEGSLRETRMNRFPRLRLIKTSNARLLSRISIVRLYRELHLQRTSLIFVNHRGYSNRIMNNLNLTYIRCFNCRRFLFYHRSRNKWTCHSCQKEFNHRNYRLSSRDYSYPGIGIERYYEFLTRYFSPGKVRWISSDIGRDRIIEVYNEIREGLPRIILMTQIMIKGYHLSNLGSLIYVDSYYRKLKDSDKLIQLIQFAGRKKLRERVNVETYDTNQRYLSTDVDYRKLLVSILEGEPLKGVRIIWRYSEELRKKLLKLRENFYTLCRKLKLNVLYVKKRFKDVGRLLSEFPDNKFDLEFINVGV